MTASPKADSVAPDTVAVRADHLSSTELETILQTLAKDIPIILPTETVYGLAANAASDKAVTAIYDMKGRPAFNPLIAHVANRDMAARYAHITPNAELLMQAFWPGPLTLVLDRRRDVPISPLVTAGLESIGLRCPDHPLAHQILKAFDKALAAPSANISGRTSPTTVTDAIKALEGKPAYAIDGGQTSGGIESTILRVETGRLTLLRPGLITPDDIKHKTGLDICYLDQGQKLRHQNSPIAPGMLEKHYAPSKPLYLNIKHKRTGHFLIGFGAYDGDQNLSPKADLQEAAHNLYLMIRMADSSEDKAIDIAPIPLTGIGAALQDRLKRASVKGDSPQAGSFVAGNIK